MLKTASALVLVLSALLALPVAQSASAQETTERQSRQPMTNSRPADRAASELEKANLSRVAASAPQIREVLVKEPGILVELKRWVAKESSDKGQIVSDEDLTDTAILDRLTTDVAFRSAATQILQRYGYLRPGLNPDSEMGKQQELMLKERAKRLVQIEAQEDSEAIKPRKLGDSDVNQTACEGKNSRDCEQNASRSLNRGSLSEGENLVPKQKELPSPSDAPAEVSPRMLRANGAADNGFSYENVDPTVVSASLSQPGKSRSYRDGIFPDDLPSDNTTYGMPEQLRRAATGAAPDENLVEGNPPIVTGTLNTANARRRTEPQLSRDRLATPGAMVHRPNPYADIPSLYDLYVQAPSREQPPKRFGTEVFQDGLRDVRAIPMDLPVGPDYVVGPGDSLSIDLWGGLSSKLVRVVDRQGRVTLPEAGPLLVSGRSLGEVQQAVQRAVGTQYRDTSADVSVSRLRTIRIYVVGEVQEPGAYDISSLSTALNALVSAGGITPRGSLRNLRHMRGRSELEVIDAYDLLLNGVTPDAQRFENGDTLMVPPVGAQVTVTGMVRRPAIYELGGETAVADVLELAGGILPAAALQHVEVQRLEAHQKRTMLSLDLSVESPNVSQLASLQIKDGDEIHIFPIASYNQNAIYLQGHVLRPGRYSYREGMKLTDLVATYKDLLPEPAAHYGEIIRLDAPDFRPSVVSFDLASAMKNPATAPLLQPLDTVRIYSRFDFEPAPTVSVVGEVRAPGSYRTAGQISVKDAVYLAGGLAPDAALDTAQLFRVDADGGSKIFSVSLEAAMHGSAADNLLLQPRDRLLIHKNISRVQPETIEITGEVANPGRYPFSANMRAADLIRAAGGLKRSADTNTADLTRYATSGNSPEQLQLSLASIRNGNASEDVALHSGDVLAIRQIPGWSDVGASVKASGELTHPGTYGIQPGERLSSVLERAGGYTAQASAYGAVLMRREIRDLEARNQLELIERMKAERTHLKALPEGDTDQKNAKLNALAQTDATLSQLATNAPIGRVVIHISSDVNQWKNTPADLALRDGDVLVIPKKANVVVVNGQVFNPTAISAQPGKSARWYLSQAGGLTPNADKKAVFVVRADGSVISKNSNDGWWSGDPLNAALRPGDMVVAPERTPKIGGANWSTILQTAQVASSLALAVAYIHP